MYSPNPMEDRRETPNLGELEERMKASSWEDPGLVFPNTKGKIRRRDSAVRTFKRYLEEAGIPTDVRFHDLRHTAGTLALRQGMPLHAVSKILGHSDPAVTLRRYAHVLEDMEDEGGGRWTTSSTAVFKSIDPGEIVGSVPSSHFVAPEHLKLVQSL